MAYATIIRGDTRQSYIALATDGSSFFIPRSLLKSFFLKERQQLSETEFLALQQKVSYRLTLDKALSLISRRDHGEKELTLKLIQKGFDKTISMNVVDELVSKHIVDNVKFAYQLIVSRQRKNPEGIPLLKMRLKSKMLSSSDIEKAIAQYLKDDTYYDDILKAIEKLKRKNTAQDTLLPSMIKKGFPKRDVIEVLSDIEKENR